MKILQICSARQLGGGEKHLADLANGLARCSHAVFVAVPPASPLLAELPAVPEQNIVELAMRTALNVSTALKLVRFVRQNQIEIVHAHVARDYPLAALVSQRAGARLVITRHVLFPLHGIHRLTLRRTSRIIAVSKAVASGLRAQGIFDQEKIVCVYNGVDVGRFEKADGKIRADRRWRVGMVGHLAPIKGQDDFIRAAAIVCRLRDDIEFVIAGEDKSRGGEHRKALERLIDELSLKQRVSLVGWVEDVAKLLPTFDLFVSPSHSEPFGLSIIEAMAGGIPVIASRSEGALEIIDDSQTGRLFSIGNIEALASTILDLFSDDQERVRLSKNARRAVRERFTLERMLAATEEVYRNVLDEE